MIKKVFLRCERTGFVTVFEKWIERKFSFVSKGKTLDRDGIERRQLLELTLFLLFQNSLMGNYSHGSIVSKLEYCQRKNPHIRNINILLKSLQDQEYFMFSLYLKFLVHEYFFVLIVIIRGFILSIHLLLKWRGTSLPQN